MVFFERTTDELIADALNELQEYTNITQLSPGAKARALLEITSKELNNAYRVFDLNLARAFLNGANGRFLDYIGDLFGIDRLEAVVASVDVTQQTVKFYVEAGSFGDINDSQNIQIPQGTIISTNESEEGANDAIEFIVLEDTLLLASNSEQYVSVEAVVPGVSSNIGVNVLVNHDFTNYSDSSDNTLLITNVAPITNGREAESDVNYRFRISQATTSAEAANETAVRLEILSVPGVADVTIIPHIRGIGTFGAYIKSTSTVVSESLLSSIQEVIDVKQALGNAGFALEPTLAGIELVIKLNLTGDFTADELVEIELNAINATEDYINNLDIGEEFIQQELISRILRADDRIRNLGTTYEQPFDEIYLYREALSEDNRVRSALLNDYQAASTERIVLEPSIATPVIIRF
jgi:uncharacterized phage protein gp47/JayE